MSAGAALADYERWGYSYAYRDGPAGVRVHLIGRAGYPAGLFSVVAGAEFGSAHGVCVGPSGERHDLPDGTAHLVEHVMLMRHWRSGRDELARQFAAFANGRVDRERTYWWLAPGGTDDADVAGAIGRAARLLLDFFTAPIDDDALPDLLTSARTDVGNEIRYREGKEAFVITNELFRLLYPDHPLGANPMGSRESLATIGVDDLRRSLIALRNALACVTVLAGEVTPAFGDALVAALEDALAVSVPPEEWRPEAAAVRVARGRTRSQLERQGPAADVAAAFALPPLSAAAVQREDHARAVVIGHLADVSFSPPGPACLSGPLARTLLLRRAIWEPWLVDRDARLETEARTALIRWREHFDAQTEMALLRRLDDPGAVVRLCNVADLHGLRFDELAEAARDLSPDDVDDLVTALGDADGSAQVYVGPPLVTL